MRSVTHRIKAAAQTSDPQVLNIQTVVELERESRQGRTFVERLTDRVTAIASSAIFVVGHIGWFTVWIVMNVQANQPFDPYPFNFLTLMVSLEAIVLTSFVLMSQKRMAFLADRREHLDLQVNLLAEEELTAILKVVCLVAEKAGIDVTECDPRIDRLLNRTDVKGLADELTRELKAERGPGG